MEAMAKMEDGDRSDDRGGDRGGREDTVYDNVDRRFVRYRKRFTRMLGSLRAATASTVISGAAMIRESSR